MPDDRKLILTPFTGRKKKWKVQYNKIKIHTGKRRQNSVEKDAGSFYNKQEDGKGAFYNDNENDNSENDNENYNENNEQ